MSDINSTNEIGTSDKHYVHKTMAKGRTGLWIEAWKFSVYLALPILASAYYNDPARQKASIDYWKYIQYPANPNTDMRKQIEELKKQKEQRQAYRQQMQELQERAERSREQQQKALEEEEAAKKRGWWTSLWWSTTTTRKQSESQA